MDKIVSDIQLDYSFIICDEEIQYQNMLLEQLINAALDVSDDVSKIQARDLEFDGCQDEYNMFLDLLQKELKSEENFMKEIAEIKKELDESPYFEDIKTHAMLENLVDQKARKLSNQFDKKLTKEQIVDLKQSRIELEREKNNVIRLQKLTEELESVQLEHRELIAIKDQKMKRFDNLKTTYDDVMGRRANLLNKKEELEQELEELDREDTTSCDDSSDDEFDITVEIGDPKEFDRLNEIDDF